MNSRLLMLACGLSLAASAAFAAVPQMATDGAVAHFCGGVSAEDRRDMRPLESQANLKLMFVTAKRNGYLANVALTVGDGKSVRFSTTTDGPICLLQLPPGRYQLTAEFGGVKRSSSVQVGRGGKLPQASFSFPGDEFQTNRASPEEKQQAAEAEGKSKP